VPLDITSFDLNTFIDGVDEVTLIDTVNIRPGNSIFLDLPEQTFADGQYIFEATVSNPNGVADDNPFDNTQQVFFLVNNEADTVPFRERFEATNLAIDTRFTAVQANTIGWELINAPGNGDTTNTAMGVNIRQDGAVAREYFLYSPIIDFGDARRTTMSFKVSYAGNPFSTDQLSVLVSVDCGETFPFVLYRKDADQLLVADTTADWVPSLPEHWVTESINLSAFTNTPDVRVAFVFTSGLGNNLYIDDVEFFADNLTVRPNDVLAAEEVRVWPNPAESEFNLTFNLADKRDLEMAIYDATGRLAGRYPMPNTLNQTYQFDFSDQPNGIYLLRIVGNDFAVTKRVRLNF